MSHIKMAQFLWYYWLVTWHIPFVPEALAALLDLEIRANLDDLPNLEILSPPAIEQE